LTQYTIKNTARRCFHRMYIMYQDK